MCSYSLALGNYSFEPYGKLVAGVINDVAVFPMIVVDLCSLPHSQPCFVSRLLVEKGRLLRRRSCLGANLQSLNRESEFLAALGTVATVSLNNLTGRF